MSCFVLFLQGSTKRQSVDFMIPLLANPRKTIKLAMWKKMTHDQSYIFLFLQQMLLGKLRIEGNVSSFLSPEYKFLVLNKSYNTQYWDIFVFLQNIHNYRTMRLRLLWYFGAGTEKVHLLVSAQSMRQKIDHGKHIAPIGFLLTLHCYCSQ